MKKKSDISSKSAKKTPTKKKLGASGIKKLETLVSSWKTRPTWDEYFISTAILISSRSACDRLNVGCVVVSGGEHPNRIIAAGYNGFLPGAAHNSCVRGGHEQATVHAEQNAISDAARRGVSLNNSSIYITHFPCINCAKILLAAGVKKIKYLHDYHNDDLAKKLIKEAGVELEHLFQK